MQLKILLIGAILAWQAGYTQTGPNPSPATSQKDANVKAVKAWYTAFEKKDWNSMQQILAAGFTFSSPLDDHIDIKAFKERCWPNAFKIKRVDLDKFIIDGDNVVVISNGYTTEGKLFRNSDYFKLKNGKISAYECFFGPGVNYPNSGK